MRRFILTTTVAGIFSLIFTGCFSVLTFSWERIEIGLDRAEWYYAFPDTTRHFVVYKIDPQNFAFQVLTSKHPKSLSEWQQESQVPLLMNGVYFHEDFLPSGLVMVEGERIGNRMFDFEKSGAILFQEEKIEIIHLKDHQPENFLNSAQTLLQSYPFYIYDGQKWIQKDSENSGRRTALGIDKDGLVYIIIAPFGDLSLYQLMNELAEMPIAFQQVLNLDGGGSTGLLVDTEKHQEYIPSVSPLPNIITVSRRENSSARSGDKK